MSKCDKNALVVTADMMRVIPIPILSLKNSNISEIITVYNQTYCELGENTKAYCIVSHEAEIRKTSNEFINFILDFIKSQMCENVENLIIWTDNCSSQNKNWRLYSSLVMIINDSSIKLKNLSLKYLECGHTFMSSDALHGVISQKLNRDKLIFTPNHIIEQIKESRNNVIVRAFTHEDILMFDNKCKSNASKIFSISDVKKCQFRKNSFDIHVKFDHEKDFQTFYFGKNVQKFFNEFSKYFIFE